MRQALIVAALVVSATAPRGAAAQQMQAGTRVQSLASASVPVDVLAANAETAEQWSALGRALYDAARYRESIAAHERALQLRKGAAPDDAWQIARGYARLSNRKQALRWLMHAREMGLRDELVVHEEPAFAGVLSRRHA
jgi:tetratricopeptide (TPR) repeat protein